ncbi:MAG: glucosamine-6-phosphate deaminase [Kiritimatiellia bacterium]
MDVKIFTTESEAAAAAGEFINSYVSSKPEAVLGLATGSTPLSLYNEMIKGCKAGVDYSKVTTFNLDEYLGLPGDHKQSYRNFMNRNLFTKININPENTHVPDGMADDPVRECARYEAMIQASGGIDIQILGIGSNGHIGFNEPPSAFDSRTRVINLTEQTIKDNSRFFDSIDLVPRQAISMGVGTILDAGSIILLNYGRSKAQALKRAVEKAPDIMNPASALQLHTKVAFYMDEASASSLTKQHKT